MYFPQNAKVICSLCGLKKIYKDKNSYSCPVGKIHKWRLFKSEGKKLDAVDRKFIKSIYDLETEFYETRRQECNDY